MSDLDDFLEDAVCGSKVIRRECTTALSPSRLPGLDFALNPYTKCFHHCTYCYAPYIMRTSPQEWGQGIIAKVNIAKVLAKELPRKTGTIGLGTVTDPYQPVEKELLVTRACLEKLVKVDAKVSVLTKSDLVTRDIDLLSRLPQAEVGVTLNSISDERASVFEPCAPPPSRRLEAVAKMVGSGINTYVFLGPVIPTMTDYDLEGLIGSIASSGARSIMVDRLNLRPGMKERMTDRLAKRFPQDLARFDDQVGNDEYYHGIIRTIEQLCASKGLKCVPAF